MTSSLLSPGITTLVTSHRIWVEGQRIGLVTHPAALDSAGTGSCEVLIDAGINVTALFGPEHGFLGQTPAGGAVAHQRHPALNIPVYSLYGENRRPSATMMNKVDTLVFDLQDIAARCYTYVSTLRYVMEACAEHGKRLIVCDRPVPLPLVTDGPILDPASESFVGAIPAPMSYGMTPAETAHWLAERFGMDLDLHLAPMRNYSRESVSARLAIPWIPPSPQLKSWEATATYLATIFAEAVPMLDNGRDTSLAFQVLGTPWRGSTAWVEAAAALRLPGVRIHRHHYRAAFGILAGRRIRGIRLTVTNPRTFKPVTTGIALLQSLQEALGADRLWKSQDVRPEFFDKLYGTSSVREALLADATAGEIAASWRPGLTAFRRQRRKHLLYSPSPGKAS